MIANTTIEENINKRLAKILHMQQQTNKTHKHHTMNRVTSPKSSQIDGSTINSNSNSNQNIDSLIPPGNF